MFDCDFNSGSRSVTHVSSVVRFLYRNACSSTLQLSFSNVAFPYVSVSVQQSSNDLPMAFRCVIPLCLFNDNFYVYYILQDMCPTVAKYVTGYVHTTNFDTFIFPFVQLESGPQETVRFLLQDPSSVAHPEFECGV